jgi:hypothetical protein
MRPDNGANLPARMFENYDDGSFLVSLFHTPVSLGDLVQGIASIDHRLNKPDGGGFCTVGASRHWYTQRWGGI